MGKENKGGIRFWDSPSLFPRAMSQSHACMDMKASFGWLSYAARVMNDEMRVL